MLKAHPEEQLHEHQSTGVSGSSSIIFSVRVKDVLLFWIGAEFFALLLTFISMGVAEWLNWGDFLESTYGQPPSAGAMLYCGVLWSAVLSASCYVLVRRIYKLRWTAIGLTLCGWRRGMIWALVALPVAFAVNWFESNWWRWLDAQLPWRITSESLLEMATQARFVYGMPGLWAGFAMLLLLSISEGILAWGLLYNALEHESTVPSAVLNTALMLLLLRLIHVGLGSTFLTALIIALIYQRSRTLVAPLLVQIGVVALSLFVG